MRNKKLKWHIFVFLYDFLGGQLFKKVINGTSAIVFNFIIFSSSRSSFNNAKELFELDLGRTVLVNKFYNFDNLLSILH